MTRAIYIIICAVGLALAGLIGLQAWWVHYTYRLSEKEFATKANEALRKSVEQANDWLTCYETFTKVHLNPYEGFYLLRHKWKNYAYLDPAVSPPDTIPMYYKNAEVGEDFRWNSLMFSRHVNVSIIFKYHYTSNGTDTFATYANGFERATLQDYLDNFSEGQPVQHTYSPRMLDSLLRENLVGNGIFKAYDFGLIAAESNTVAWCRAGSDSVALLGAPFRVRLTPGAYFSRPYDLSLVFDDYRGLVLSDFGWLLWLSVIIVLLLLSFFFIFIRLVLRQRRLSELKNDFISNMTHEFKTPLTNIALAVESITEQKLLKEGSGENMMRIVGQESERLRENVERILQISRLEKETPQLSKERIDLRQLVSKVLAVFDPLHNAQGAVFRCHFEAENCEAEVDEIHFFNLLHNLIDNALKYTRRTPEIDIGLRRHPGGLLLSVKDNGIGIAHSNQKRIFEKFYRVPDGDLHDVKGYGLGLSYVKLMVVLHGGRIHVHSQPGQGSTFEIFIPAAT